MAKRVYLDYNATTPLDPEVADEIISALTDSWGNPSSSHSLGVKAKECIAKARRSVARMINVVPEDIIFTSGGTEANNMVLRTAARHFYNSVSLDGSRKPHVIITNMEHDSISLTASRMEQDGDIELTVVHADCRTGIVTAQLIHDAIQPNTTLISVMLANNETGILQPVASIVKAVRSCGRMRIFIHTDAAQALGKIPVDASQLGVDYLTIVGHKYYGPRIGALYVKSLETCKTPLYPLMYGGGQERGFRSGTENTAMIAGLGKASELVASNIDQYSSNMKSVRDYLEKELHSRFGGKVCFNGRFEGSERLPNTCSVSLIGPKFKGDWISRYTRPSPILLAIGVPEPIAANALRLSVGRETSKEDIDLFLEDLLQAVHSIEASL